MEFIQNLAIGVIGAAFLTGMLITAVSGSARAVKYLLGVLAALAVAALAAGLIVSRGLLIFLLFQLVAAVIIVFFAIIAGAVCGGGIFSLLNGRSAGGKITDSELQDYLSLETFSQQEGITEERALSRIRSGFYRGGRHRGRWFIHASELTTG